MSPNGQRNSNTGPQHSTKGTVWCHYKWHS
jgi:hypothetical protein